MQDVIMIQPLAENWGGGDKDDIGPHYSTL